MSFIKTGYLEKCADDKQSSINYRLRAIYKMFVINNYAIAADKIENSSDEFLLFITPYVCDNALKELCFKTTRDNASLEIRRTRSFIVREIMSFCDLFTFVGIYIKTTWSILKCKLKLFIAK